MWLQLDSGLASVPLPLAALADLHGSVGCSAAAADSIMMSVTPSRWACNRWQLPPLVTVALLLLSALLWRSQREQPDLCLRIAVTSST